VKEMNRVQREYSEEEKMEINKRYEGSRNAGEQKRLLCLKLRVVNGKKAQEISDITGYSINSVNDMISVYHHRGLESFLYRKRPGNNRKITAEAEKELLSSFEAEAKAGKILTVEDIHKSYEEKVGGSVAKRTVYYMLNRNGWRKIMPRSKHPNKAKDEEIKAYKKNQ
jgi:transposase